MTSTLRATLRATQEQLLQTESQLNSTQAQLNSTKDQLEITQLDLHKTQTELDECKFPHDLFINHTLAYDNRVYYLSLLTPLNITAHQQTCAGRLGGHLVEIRHQHQYDAINDFLTNQQLTRNIYLGMTDAVREPQWTYMSDNSTVTFVKWISGQPNGGQHCACLERNGVNYEMRDLECFTKAPNRFMCEVSL